MALALYDSLSRTTAPFVPADPAKVTVYTCGPTPYDRLHIGTYRRFVATDLLIRYLLHSGMKVLHVVNVTDIDDKILARVAETGESRDALVERYFASFLSDCDLLGIRRADLYPMASGHIDDMIAMTAELMEKGIAYEKHRSVYVNIGKLPGYGSLSGVGLSKIRLGSTVDLDDYAKENPRDFTLFKRSSLLEFRKGYSFATPWGQARPGWHIECSAMSSRYLGVPFDLHTGSVDHLFPHHENEMAIARALGDRPLARHWLHSNLVTVGRGKMARSAGNAYTLDDLAGRGFPPRVVRFLLVSTHYRRPVPFSLKRLKELSTSLERIDHCIRGLFLPGRSETSARVADLVEAARAEFFAALDEDLNVSRATSALFRLARKLDPSIDSRRIDADDRSRVLTFFQEVNSILGCLDVTPEPLGEGLLEIVSRREEARRGARWKEADRLREELRQQGIWIIDTPHGPRWKRIPPGGSCPPSEPPLPTAAG
jgi:cysteinyl-tRNA synthetase